MAKLKRWSRAHKGDLNNMRGYKFVGIRESGYTILADLLLDCIRPMPLEEVIVVLWSFRLHGSRIDGNSKAYPKHRLTVLLTASIACFLTRKVVRCRKLSR